MTYQLEHPTSSYFYDDTLGLYINRKPLLVSSKVLKAAEELGIRDSLRWDEHGYICGISQPMAKSLSDRLGIRMLNVKEFMNLARRNAEVRSPEFAEWLSDTFAISPTTNLTSTPADTTWLTPSERDGREVLVSADGSCEIPISRPGWFDIQVISSNGFPTQQLNKNQPGLWKFWSPEATDYVCGAVRSFVTSSGTCSLDLGIPVFAKHPMLMIRECYSRIKIPSLSALPAIWSQYEQLTHARDDVALKVFFDTLELPDLHNTMECDVLESQKYEEMLVDLRGKKILMTGNNSPRRVIKVEDLLATFDHDDNADSVYVIGHPRPDADVVFSALFEAARRKALRPDMNCHAWCEYVPPEAQKILGAKMSELLSQTKKPQGHHEIVVVDCATTEPQYMMNIRSVIDHHIIQNTFPHYVALSQEVSWSSTIQVYIKMLGSGLDLAPTAARMLLEATRLEAEPTLMSRMSELDRLAIQRLTSTAETAASYEELMAVMTRASDPEEMFYKDYKESSFGFAVIKTRQVVDFNRLALMNNARNNLPLTIVKQIVYRHDFVNVETETISIFTNSAYHDKGFGRAIKDVMTQACRCFHGDERVSVRNDTIHIKCARHQTPRLLLMPLIEQLVKEHLRFAYSAAIKKYISIGFYSGKVDTYGQPGEKTPALTRLSYETVRDILATASHTSMLTLPEYWKVYYEFTNAGFTFATRSLRDAQHIELLDTLIRNSQHIVHGSNRFAADTSRQHICLSEPIPLARPALICPEDTDIATGLPTRFCTANTYGDLSLWRYWSPDSRFRTSTWTAAYAHDMADVNVATRGHIFIMNQTCVDLKVRSDEATQFMTFRPIYEDIPDLRYSIEKKGNWVCVHVFPRLFSSK